MGILVVAHDLRHQIDAMSNDAAEAAIDGLMQCIFSYVPDECTAFWARCIMVNGHRDLAILYDTGNAGKDVFALSLASDARDEISECFREYHEALKRPGKEGWQVATVVAEVEADGDTHFHIDTSYESIREEEMQKFIKDWEAKYLPGRRVVGVVDPRCGIPFLPLELDRLLDESMRWLAARTQDLDVTVRIREHQQWSFDMGRGEIRFDFDDGRSATAPFQAIGTMNTQDGTWLWAWDNPSIIESLRQHALTVRSYGEEHGHELLTTRKYPCDEQLAWRLTALAAKLNNAQGAYRAPAGTTLLFLTFGEVKLEQAQRT